MTILKFPFNYYYIINNIHKKRYKKLFILFYTFFWIYFNLSTSYKSIEFADILLNYVQVLSNYIEEEIINSDLPEIKVDEEINDYIKVINEYIVKNKIEKLEVKLKEEINIMEKAKILDEIMKLKGVKQWLKK